MLTARIGGRQEAGPRNRVHTRRTTQARESPTIAACQNPLPGFSRCPVSSYWLNGHAPKTFRYDVVSVRFPAPLATEFEKSYALVRYCPALLRTRIGGRPRWAAPEIA
jgi:hypothetical protein